MLIRNAPCTVIRLQRQISDELERSIRKQLQRAAKPVAGRDPVAALVDPGRKRSRAHWLLPSADQAAK